MAWPTASALANVRSSAAMGQRTVASTYLRSLPGSFSDARQKVWEAAQTCGVRLL